MPSSMRSSEPHRDDRRVPPEPERRRGRWSPILAGMLLDAVDFATFGPIGLQLGLVVGAAAGWLVTRDSRLSPAARAGVAALCGAYCMLPLTAFVPAATLVGTAVRLLEDHGTNGARGDRPAGPGEGEPDDG